MYCLEQLSSGEMFPFFRNDISLISPLLTLDWSLIDPLMTLEWPLNDPWLILDFNLILTWLYLYFTLSCEVFGFTLILPNSTLSSASFLPWFILISMNSQYSTLYHTIIYGYRYRYNNIPHYTIQIPITERILNLEFLTMDIFGPIGGIISL